MTPAKSDPFEEYKNYHNIKGSVQSSRMLVDRIMPTLPGTAQLVLYRIYRQTIGYRNSNKSDKDKVWDTIAHSQFQKWCHIKSRNTVKIYLALLHELELIDIEESAINQPDSYRINLDEFDKYDDSDYEHPKHSQLVATIKI